jgi:hypothetical protein
MRRSLFPSLGLGIALVVTLAVGRYVGAQESTTTQCDACAGWAKLDAKVKEAGGWMDFGKTDSGIVAVALTPQPDKGPIVIDALREFDTLTHSKDLKLSSQCAEMQKLARAKGTKIEIVPLRTGALYLMTSSKPKIVQSLHEMYDKQQQAMLEGAKATCGDKKVGKDTLLSSGDDEKSDKEKSPDYQKTNDQ